jgi:hypothetical protein
MATYATQDITTAGTAITYTAASAADRFLPADRVFMHVKNANAGSVTVTIATPGTVDSLAVGDRIISIPTTQERMIALPDSLYRSSDGLGDVTFSPNASVTVAVVRI